MRHDRHPDVQHQAPLRAPAGGAAPPVFRLTERDIAILRWLARYRFLSAEHVATLDGGGARVTRRLKALYEHELVDRPLPQLVQLMTSGSAPLVYALTRDGAKVLEDIDGAALPRLDWIAKPTRTSFLFMQHTLETAETMVAFERACAAPDAPTFYDQAELLTIMPEATRAARNPYSWRAKVKAGDRAETVGLVPDRLFSLYLADDTRLNFALELDRGTMSVEPTVDGAVLPPELDCQEAGRLPGGLARRRASEVGLRPPARAVRDAVRQTRALQPGPARPLHRWQGLGHVPVHDAGGIVAGWAAGGGLGGQQG